MLYNVLIFIYIFLQVIPFAIPRYYLFLNSLVLPVKWISCILVTIASFEALGFIYLINQAWCTDLYLIIYRYIFIFIFALLSFVFIKERFSKVMFVYLMMLCYGAFILGNSHFIESRFFSKLSIEYPYLINSLVTIVLIIITYPILFYFLKNYFLKVMNVINTDIWKYIWMIPLMFSSIGAVYSCAYSKEYTAEFSFIFLRYLILIGTFFTCFILLKTLKQTEINIRLEENIKYKKNQLALQKEQYMIMTKNIEETKKARHDLRHHICLIQTFMKDKEYENLEEYINQYQNTLPIDTDLALCNNYVVNAIVCYYVNLAKQKNITINVDLKIPDKTSISDSDLCIIFGNCLENAIEGCMKIKSGQKFISIKSHLTNYMIALTIDNSFSGTILKEENSFISTKESTGHGIGISSVYAVVSKYNGHADFEVDFENKVFKVSILLKNESRVYV